MLTQNQRIRTMALLAQSRLIEHLENTGHLNDEKIIEIYNHAACEFRFDDLQITTAWYNGKKVIGRGNGAVIGLRKWLKNQGYIVKKAPNGLRFPDFDKTFVFTPYMDTFFHGFESAQNWLDFIELKCP